MITSCNNRINNVTSSQSSSRCLSTYGFNAPAPRVPRAAPQGTLPGSPPLPSSSWAPSSSAANGSNGSSAADVSGASLASSQEILSEPDPISQEDIDKELAERRHYLLINERQAHV